MCFFLMLIRCNKNVKQNMTYETEDVGKCKTHEVKCETRVEKCET